MQTQLDRGTVKTKLREFAHAWNEKIDGWRETGQGHTESSYAQSFWSDLLRCFDVISQRIDLFERDAVRASTGNTGFIDFFWSGVAIGEAKSLDYDLDRAFQQALDYLSGGSIADFEMPKYVLVTNFAQIRIDRLGDEPWSTQFVLEDIPEHVDQLMFLAGQDTVTKIEEKAASLEAAARMAALWQSLVGEEADEAVGEEAPTDPEEEDRLAQDASILLTRLLFLLYGDDAGLWEEDLFRRWVEYDTTADSLGPQLQALFGVLNTPDTQRRRVPDALAKFPYVNGGIFDGSSPVPFLNENMRQALLEACRFRWTHISPAVFGALFQLVKSKEARRSDGEHYTSEANIMKTIGPLFLDDYRARADRLIAKKSATKSEFDALQNEIASNLYVDPACGAGNFLNVAYAQLRQIETDLIVERARRWDPMNMAMDVTADQRLTIDGFWGFEINWWPAKIAETAMFLVDHQANLVLAKARGAAPDRLPITITAHIVHGNALSHDWADDLPDPVGQTFIFGNPPFLGHASRNTAQAEELRNLWGSKDIYRLDYVTAWHAQAIKLFAHRRGEFAYVTTNSITQGDQPAHLFRPILAEGWVIKFAHRTFAWDSQAPGQAAVHCVIVGFARSRGVKSRLWKYTTVHSEPIEIQPEIGINPYLADGPNVLVEKRSHPLSTSIHHAAYGNMARDDGNLIVEPDKYQEVIADPIAAKYIRPFVGARELLHRADRWCLWLTDMEPSDILRSAVLKQRLHAVRDFRSRSKASSTRQMAETPHLFGQRSQPNTDFVGVPIHVSESRRYYPVSHFTSDVIASNATFTIRDPDGLQFAVMSSSMFITWQKTIGGRIKSDLRFASTLTWYTFPFPEIDQPTREAICEAGRGVLAARSQHPQRSLAEHYNPLTMDPVLIRAHNELDRQIDKVYGSTRRITSDEQRKQTLFKTYQKMTMDNA